MQKVLKILAAIELAAVNDPSAVKVLCDEAREGLEQAVTEEVESRVEQMNLIQQEKPGPAAPQAGMPNEPIPSAPAEPAAEAAQPEAEPATPAAEASQPG